MENKLTSEKKSQKIEWSKTIRKNDDRCTITVEELDGGGFLIIKDSSYKVGQEWKYETTKSYSETNPLEDEDIEKSEDSSKKEDMFEYMLSGGKPKFNLLPK